MREVKTLHVDNGGIDEVMYIWHCERCGEEVPEWFPHWVENDGVYCPECAFMIGKATEEEYLRMNMPGRWRGYKAAIIDGKPAIYEKRIKWPWEKAKKDLRHSTEYTNWRTAVFERDEYTCKACGQVGGKLNAHHIRPYAKFPSLRLDVDNGVTLCEACHKELHRKERLNNGI